MSSFAHLHCHSEYSLLDGLSRVNELVERALELNQPAIALTDHGAMYGTMPFYRACIAAGIKPIIGIETYLAARSMSDRDAQLDKNRFHMLLLAQNQTGYLNLLEIASTAQLEGYYYKPRIDRAFMSRYSDGIIATTGCMAGEIPQALNLGKTDLAHQLMGEYVDIFGKDRLFIELQEHSIPELSDINKKLIEMAPRYGLQHNFLATNDVHYTRAEDADPHQVLLCIQTSSTLSEPKMTFSDRDYYLKSYDEMLRLFKGYPQDVVLNSLQNSVRIADMCHVSLDFAGYHLPNFDVPEGFTSQTYLRHLCEQGLLRRYGENRFKHDEGLRQRLDHELGVISRMGFETYFLIVWDLCEWAVRSDAWWEAHQDPYPYDSYSDWKENDIWFNVRGSGAGSVVAYTLGITSIDPLVNGLIFERFLNPGRVSMPDIDLDYPDDTRPQMVAYTQRRYGREKVAQIITFGTMGARAAIRDVGRALDMPLPEVDAVARMVPAIPGKPVKIQNVLDSDHEFYSSELENRYKAEEQIRTLLDTAQNLEGVARHASSHAAGVIISDRPLQEYVPLNKPTSGDEGLGGVDRVTQWPMEVVESIGLLKVDFLGLSTLTVMRRAARLIEQRHGINYTMDNIPYDQGHLGPDPTKNPDKLFDMLERGDVAGVFQVEGCLGAETLIGHRTIKELYQEFQQKSLSNNSTWAKTLKTSSCYVDEGKFRPNAILKVVYSGIKPVYRLTDSRGHWLKATADHYFLTKRGWVRLGDLNLAQDLLLVKSSASRVRRSCTVCGQPLRTGYVRAIYCETCSAKMTANPSRPEVKQKIAHSKLGTVPWNKGLTAETSADTTWIKNLRIYNESQKGISLEERVGAEKAASIKQKLSERNSGRGNPMYGRVPSETKTYSKAGYRPDLGHYVRSTWEADLARVFVYHELAYQYESQTFELIDKDGNCLTYTPDFYVPALDTWFEVKGWMDKVSAKKIHLFQEQYPENKLLVVDKTVFAEFQLQYADLVEWECPKFPKDSEWVAIHSIEYVGEEETYDIQMRPPGNNFIASGFVVHNSGMRRLMMEMRPRRFDHIIAAISLYRPGPMENIPEYIRRMHASIYDNKDIVEYHTPALAPILQDTYGILVYQEQIIRIAADLAGYEPGEADMIRKAVSKKKKDLIDKHRIQFTDGAMARGFSQEVCDAIWGDIEFFARYGFNKCLPGDVEVVDASNGRLHRLEDIYQGKVQLGDTVSCDVTALKLKKGKIIDVLDNGVKPVYRLTTSLGKQIEATANHPFYTFAGWQWLGELEVGQQIALPRSLPVEGENEWPEHEVIALGHLLAEGNLCHPHSVYFYSQQENSLNDYVQAAEQFRNVVCSVAMHRDTWSVYAKRINRHELPGIVTWAQELGIWGKNAQEKEIPADVFALKNEQIALLLGRMWDGDGSVIGHKRNSIHAYYATASERMGRQIQHLLLRLGIMSSFRMQEFGYKEGRIGYQVHVMGGEHMIRFGELVGPHLLREDQKALCLALGNRADTSARDTVPVAVKELIREQKVQSGVTWTTLNSETGISQREFYPTNAPTKKGFRRETIGRLAHYFDSDELRRYAESDIYWDEIIAIEYVGEKQTYDLTIADTHNFVANDILVHNSHAADYAKVTCQTAFLKAHYPVEYLTAMLSVERDNTDKVRRYFAEAKNLGIDIAPPDVNLSGLDFTIEDGERSRIRFGLGAVKNAGEGALNLMLEEREANGRFSSLQNLCDRVDLRRVGKRALEFVIKARAFDAWGRPDQLLVALDRLVTYSSNTHSAAAAGQMSLFGTSMGPSITMKVNLLPAEGEYKKIEHKALLEWEKEALGVHVSEHPLERPLAMLETHTSTKIGDIDANWSGKQVKLAGMISQLRTLTTKKGDPMAFGTLEDLENKIEVVFFPRTWREVRDEVQVDQVMLVTGKVQTKDDQANIIVDRVQTKIEKAQAADSATGDDDWGYGFEEDVVVPPTPINGRSAPPTAPINGNGTVAPKPAAPTIAEPLNGYGTPPPPPNFDDDAQALPPAKSEPPLASQSLVFGEKHEGVNGRSNGKHKLIIVEVKPVGNWHHAFRQTVKLAQAHQGDDQIRLRLAGQPLAIDFPDHTTCYSTELVDQIERLPGILRVYAV